MTDHGDPRSDDLRRRIERARTRPRTEAAPPSTTREVTGLVFDIGIVRIAQEDVRLKDGTTSVRTVVTHLVRMRDSGSVSGYLHRSIEDVPVAIALTMPEDLVTFEVDEDGIIGKYRLRRLHD